MGEDVELPDATAEAEAARAAEAASRVQRCHALLLSSSCIAYTYPGVTPLVTCSFVYLSSVLW